MPHEIFMPKLSSTMEVGSITEWYKEEGDPVEAGEAIFEVMTDKIAIEVEAYDSGTLLKKYYGTDEPVPVNQVIGYIGEPGEEVPDQPSGTEGVDKEPAIDSTTEEPLAPPAKAEEKGFSESKEPPAPQANEPVQPEAMKERPETQEEPSGSIRATPSARRLARESGIDLHQVPGSGRKGRIQMEDVRQFAAQPKEQPARAAQPEAPKQPQRPATALVAEQVIPWKGMRKVIADRMAQSKQEVPHVTLNATMNAGKLVELREELLPLVEQRTQRRLSYTDLIVKALAVALTKHPRLNAHIQEDGIHEWANINVGVAVAVEDGLLVPVIRDVQQKGLAQISEETKRLAERARQGQLSPEDMSDGTISISSLGNSRVESFNPVIRQPEVAILGIGSMRQELTMDEETGNVVQRPMLTLSLSFDHRAVDGAPAAAFLDTLIEILENPILLMV